MTTAADSQAASPASSPIDTLDIVVLMGGPSAEREVSLNSGRAVAAALARNGHRVRTSDISPQDLTALDQPADLVFIALHGTFGEDGALQRILESRGIPYAGSDAGSSELAMDKARSKMRFTAAGIPTPSFEVIKPHDLDAALQRWVLPAVIKPICQGSSVDVTIESDPESCRSSLSAVLERYGSCMIEQLIEGPELTVGILGDSALPVCEIRTPRRFYDYQAKYLEDTTAYLFDLELPPQLLKEIQEWSVQAHRALQCRHFSRADWMVDGRTQRPYLLEVNTIPGFTDHSLLPKAAARANMNFDQLCQTIVELASRRA